MPATTPTLTQLQRALAIAEQIQKLEDELEGVLGGESSGGAPAASASPKAAAAAKPGRRGGKRFVSPEARARMAAAQKARWAKSKGGKASAPAKPAVAGKKKRVLSPEGRARIVAALK